MSERGKKYIFECETETTLSSVRVSTFIDLAESQQTDLFPLYGFAEAWHRGEFMETHHELPQSTERHARASVLVLADTSTS